MVGHGLASAADHSLFAPTFRSLRPPYPPIPPDFSGRTIPQRPAFVCYIATYFRSFTGSRCGSNVAEQFWRRAALGYKKSTEIDIANGPHYALLQRGRLGTRWQP